MMTRFPVAQVHALADQAKAARAVPVEGLEGWTRSEVDPMRLLAVFTALRGKPGYVLRAYQYRMGGNGNGIVWAIPEGVLFPGPDACTRLAERFLNPPRPPGALDDCMEAIEGDGTPWSYLSASLFAREAAEFGAIWHGCSWSAHAIVGAAPTSDLRCPEADNAGEIDWPGRVKEIGDAVANLTLAETAALGDYLREVHQIEPGQGSTSGWQWLASRPDLWEPCVQQEQDVTQVIFYTFSRLGRERVVRHCDTFLAGQFTFRPRSDIIALGGPGYVH
jgi:hypothetical protein